MDLVEALAPGDTPIYFPVCILGNIPTASPSQEGVILPDLLAKGPNERTACVGTFSCSLPQCNEVFQKIASASERINL